MRPLRINSPQQMYPQTTAGRILNAPGMAAFNQGVNNIATLKAGGVPNVSPTQAYQASVAESTRMRMLEDQQRRAQEAHQRADPYFDFEEGKRRGHLDPDMTWAEFQQSKYRMRGATSNMQDIAAYAQLSRPQMEGESDEGYERRMSQAKLLEEAISKTAIFAGGGGSYYGLNALGNTQTLVDAPTATRREADRAGAEEDATKWAAADQAWETSFNQSAPQMDDALDRVEELIAYIDANPDMDTGMLQGFVSPKVDEIVSYLQTVATQLAIPILQEAKLNPVTELELQKIMETVADARKDPKANRASLIATARQMSGALQRMQALQDHYNTTGSTKGFARGYKIRDRGEYQPPGAAPAGGGDGGGITINIPDGG